MTALGATSPFTRALMKVGSPPSADLHHCGVHTYALASRLRASGMEARATKAPRVSARFSKSLARRRFLPNQEKVRSTTQRRGKTTKPLLASLRLTISMRSRRAFATAASTCRLGPDEFEPREVPAYLVEDQPGPVAVLDRGGANDDPHRQPFAVDQGADLVAFTCLPAL